MENNSASAFNNSLSKLAETFSQFTQSEFKRVEKPEFDAFLANYPQSLEYDVTGICEPPMGSYNDFSSGKVWPESMVAKVRLFDGSEYHGGKQPEYFIKASV